MCGINVVGGGGGGGGLDRNRKASFKKKRKQKKKKEKSSAGPHIDWSSIERRERTLRRVWRTSPSNAL